MPEAASVPDEPEQPRRKPVPVNWDDLEMALTWRSDELENFLDLRTGEVRQYRLSAFAGDAEDFELSDEADAGLAEGYLVRIEPLESFVEYGWMAEFAASVRLLGFRLEERWEATIGQEITNRRMRTMQGCDGPVTRL
jgi:hypothetical protein